MPAPVAPFKRLLSGYDVLPDSGCWVWTGQVYRNGYGGIKVFGKMTATHRFSYELHKGPIPDGMHVLHSCDVKRCINPEHLRLGTHAENMREAAERGLMLSGPRHPRFGKPYPPGIKNRLSKPVVVFGKMYSSQKEAERHLGLGSGTVRFWLLNAPHKARSISQKEYESSC